MRNECLSVKGQTVKTHSSYAVKNESGTALIAKARRGFDQKRSIGIRRVSTTASPNNPCAESMHALSKACLGETLRVKTYLGCSEKGFQVGAFGHSASFRPIKCRVDSKNCLKSELVLGQQKRAVQAACKGLECRKTKSKNC